MTKRKLLDPHIYEMTIFALPECKVLACCVPVFAFELTLLTLAIEWLGLIEYEFCWCD